MEEGTFVEWLKRDGEAVRPGDALFVLESDKATETVEALDAGMLRLGPAGAKPGAKVKVGQVLAYLTGSDSESVPENPALVATGISPVVEATVTGEMPVATSAAPSRKRASSPRARRVARELGIDWSIL